MVVKLLLFLLCVLETLQHLSYPINFCNMASTCVHDSRVVCASSPDGCSRKSFLDQCDMYEYNCDYGTQFMTKVTSSCTSEQPDYSCYQETYILFCGTLLTPTQFTQIQSSITKNPTTNGISKSSTKHFTQTLPKSITSKSHKTETSSNTVPLTVLTSTPVTTNINNNSKDETIKNYSDTTGSQTILVYCCDRPLTWETTKEVTKIVDIIINNNSDENKQKTETSTEYIITNNLNDQTTNNTHENENNITFTTINQQISDTIILDDTTIVVNTETNEVIDNNQSSTEVNEQNTSVYCCNKPLTWETTTEISKIVRDVTNNNNSDENKQTTEASTDYNVTDNLYDETTNTHENENNITFTTINQLISDTVTLYDSTIFVNTETDETVNKKQSATEIVDRTTSVYCCNRPLTWETTTEVIIMLDDLTNETNNSEENKINTNENVDVTIQTTAIVTDTTNSYSKDTSKFSTTPTTPLNEKLNSKLHLTSKQSTNCHNKCQRPLTWLTTRRRRKPFRNKKM